MLNVDPSKLKRDTVQLQNEFVLNDYIIDLAWSPCSKQVAAVTVEGYVFLVDIEKRLKSCEPIGNHKIGCNSVSWSPHASQFATSGQDSKVLIWDSSSKAKFLELDAGGDWVSNVAYNPCTKQLASGASRTVKIWNDDYNLIYESADHSSTIADIGWNPDGSGLAVAAYNGITLHVPQKQRQPRKYEWKGSSLALAWSPDAKYIATGEQDSTVHFWRVKSGADAQMWGFPTKVLQLSWSMDGRWLATGGGNSVCLWDCSGKGPEGRQPKQYEAHSNKITNLAFQPDGPFLVSTDLDNSLVVWEPLKHNKIVGGCLLSSPASSISWSKNGLLAVGQKNGKLSIFQIKNLI